MTKRKALWIVATLGLLIAALFYFWPSDAPKQGPRVQAIESMAPRPTRLKAPDVVARAPAPIEAAHALAIEAKDAAQGRFIGQVRSAGTHVPIANAELVFAHRGSAESVSADAEGAFAFEPSVLGRYRLAMASADGYFSYAPEWEQSPIALVAREQVSVEGIAVHLTAAIEYRGRVVDDQGQAVESAKVSISASSEAAMSAEETNLLSDGDGSFVFRARDFSLVRATRGTLTGVAVVDQAVQVSRKLTIVLEADDKVRPSLPQTAHDGGDEEREAGQASIRGFVVDSEGNPVPAFNLMLTQRSGIASRSLAGRAIFDSRGEFQFDNLLPGSYRVDVAASGRAMSSGEALAEIGGGPPVTITLGQGASVFGKVIDSESKAALQLAKVSVESSFGGGNSARPMLVSVVTDEDGNFELRGLRAGRRSVVVSAAQHNTKIVSALEVVEGERTGPLQIEMAAVADGEEPRTDLVGIGVILGQEEDGMLVRGLIAGGAAADAGMLDKDIIVAIDGKTVVELGWDDAIQRIRGPVGSQVTLRLRRQSEGISVVVTRKAIRN